MATNFPVGTYGHMINNTSGIVHFMRMNESSGSGDDADSLSGSTYAVSTRQPGALVGDDNKSFYFNGSSSYVNYGNNLTLTGKFSLEIWIKPSRVSGSQTFASKENYVGAWSGWTWWLDGSIPTFSRLAGVNTRYSVRSTPIAANTWTHLVVTYDGFTLRQYKNGVLVWDTPGGSIYTSGYSCILGAATNGQMADRYDPFQGYLDEFAVYNTAISASTVLQHYNRGITSPIQNLTLSRSTTGGLGGTARLKSMWTGRTTSESVILRSAESATFENTLDVGEIATLGAIESASIETAFGGTILDVSEENTINATENVEIFTTIDNEQEELLMSVEEQSLSSTMETSDSALLQHTEVATDIELEEIGKAFPQIVGRRQGLIHFAAQRLFNGHISVEYKQQRFVPVGETKYGALGQFRLGHSKLSDEAVTEYAISDLYFLVKNEIGLPLALGVATTDWYEGRIVVEFFKNIEEHEDILRTFGVFPMVTG